MIDENAYIKDDLFDEATRIVLEANRGSVSLLQRRLDIGYARACRLIDRMVAIGLVGDYEGCQARKVIMTADEFKELKL